jgi:hypothetical protein
LGKSLNCVEGHVQKNCATYFAPHSVKSWRVGVLALLKLGASFIIPATASSQRCLIARTRGWRATGDQLDWTKKFIALQRLIPLLQRRKIAFRAYFKLYIPPKYQRSPFKHRCKQQSNF